MVRRLDSHTKGSGFKPLSSKYFYFCRKFFFFKVFWKFFIPLNKTDSSQTHFGFTNLGPEMLIFSVIAKRNFKFWFGSPCIIFHTYIICFNSRIWNISALLNKLMISHSVTNLSKYKHINHLIFDFWKTI